MSCEIRENAIETRSRTKSKHTVRSNAIALKMVIKSDARERMDSRMDYKEKSIKMKVQRS